MLPKTFKDFGLEFHYDKNCVTCSDGNCHNIVTSKHDGREYSVHISTDREGTFFSVYATEQVNTSADTDIFKTFTEENVAVEFVCDTFDWFKCF